jgi:hypothetical protein
MRERGAKRAVSGSKSPRRASRRCEAKRHHADDRRENDGYAHEERDADDR